MPRRVEPSGPRPRSSSAAAWLIGLGTLLCTPPAAARGFEPWLQPDPLLERIGLLQQRAITPQEIEKADTQLHWCQTALGDGHPSTAQAQAQLGLLHLQRGDLERAQASLSGARERLQRLPREANGRAMLRVLLGLAAAADLRGQREEALTLGQLAVALRRRFSDVTEVDPLELALAQIHLRAGAPQSAEALLRAPAQGAQLTGPPAGLRRGAALLDLWARSLWELGRYEQGEAALRRAIAALEQGAQTAAGDERQAILGDLTAAQNNLAIWLLRTGRESDAEPLLTRAAQTRARIFGDRDSRTVLLQRNLAALLWLSGQPARAEALLLGPSLATDPAQPLWLGALQAELAPQAQKAIALLQKAQNGPSGGLAQEVLAHLLLQQGRLDEASAGAAALLESRRKALPQAAPALLRAHALAATVAEARGRGSDAEDHLRRALAQASGPEAPAAQSPLLLLLRGRLAAYLLSRPDGAPVRTQGAHHLAESLTTAAALLQQTAVLKPAWLRPALQLSGAALLGAALPGGPDGVAVPVELSTALLRFADAAALGEALAGELRALAEREPGEAAEALLHLYRQRAGALLPPSSPGDAVLAPTAAQLQPLEASISAAEQQLQRKSAALLRLFQRRALDAAQVEQFLSRRLGALVLLLRTRARDARAPARTAPFSRGGKVLPPLRGPLSQPEAPPPSGEGGGHRYAALVLRPGEAGRLLDLGDAARTDGAVERLGQLVEAQRDPAPELTLLGQLLAEPLLRHLPATGRLYIVAPAELGGVPFSALPAHGGLLSSRGPVQVYAYPGELLDPGERPPATPRGEPLERLLLLGAPLLREPLPYLPRTWPPHLGHGELAEVNQLLRQHRYDPRGGPVTGLAATKSRLRAWLPSRVVHLFAPLAVLPDAQAQASQDRALAQLRSRALSFPLGELVPQRTTLPPVVRAGLALAASTQPEGSPVRGDDGFLPAQELAQFDLRRTALLVLSGPTIGARVPGALAQLEQAALRAGATQVVLTLWRPADPAAKQIMGQLYRAWVRTGDAAEAVRELQLAMHVKGEPPLLWAGLRATARR